MAKCCKVTCCLMVLGLTACCVAEPPHFYINEYSEDSHGNDGNCVFGTPGTAALIYRVQPNVCQQITHLETSLDKYVKIETDGRGNITAFKDLCDYNCTLCTEYSHVADGLCFNTPGQGSAMISERMCTGSPNLDISDGVSVFYYSDPSSCSIQNEDKDSLLYIRNYEGPTLCSLDYMLGDVKRYYSLNVTENEGELFYTGLLSCTTNDCTPQSCTAVNNLTEGDCHHGHHFSVRAIQTSMLAQCRQSGPTVSSSTTKPDTGNNQDYGNNSNDPALIGGVVGGGVAVALVVFGIALAYRRYEFRQRRALNVSYTTVKNYGTASYDDEGMTTDI